MKAVWASVVVACVAWVCGTAAGAEWVARVRQEIAAGPPRPRRVMVVFPLVEEGSDTGEVGWGRGLIAIQAMWRSSFVPERLLAEGADVNAVSGEDRVTVLHLAAGRGRTDMVRLFLQREADVTLTDGDGCTALCDAARAGVTGVVQLLLDAGADPNCASRYGTALHAAADANRHDIARQLLEAGARLEGTDAWGRTPLIAAAWNGHEQMVRLLAEAGARLDARADVWHTALHVAGRAGHADAVRALLELGATPGPRDKEAETPLHFAAGAGSLACVQALVDAGAEVNCLNSRSHTPLREARDNGHEDVARYLEAYGGRDSATTGEGETTQR
jgi:ankyrin repeat protein